MPDGVSIMEFAVDIALTVVSKGEQILINKAITFILRIVSWIQSKLLKLASEKTDGTTLLFY